MGVDKKVEETLKVLTLKAIEQGMEKIAGVFDRYTEKIGQEIAIIHQKISDLESRLDCIEKLFPSSGVSSQVALQVPIETEISSELASSTSYGSTLPTRQPVRRDLEPASFVPREDTEVRNPQRDGFRGYRPVRGGIVEEEHVKVAVFSRELDRRKEAASATPLEGRTVVLSHSVREDTTANEPINRPGYTPQEVASENRAEIEGWLHKTEGCFSEMPSETRKDVMPHYTQLKTFLCKKKKEEDSSCAACLIQNTIDCPLFKP